MSEIQIIITTGLKRLIGILNPPYLNDEQKANMMNVWCDILKDSNPKEIKDTFIFWENEVKRFPKDLYEFQDEYKTRDTNIKLTTRMISATSYSKTLIGEDENIKERFDDWYCHGVGISLYEAWRRTQNGKGDEPWGLENIRLVNSIRAKRGVIGFPETEPKERCNLQEQKSRREIGYEFDDKGFVTKSPDYKELRKNLNLNCFINIRDIGGIE